ncbi:hypothetical protein SASPL_132582 [Salvia splendens]|uniref:Uncharacterized protein n=1 Tax=Salvia splendens TaxID=180675 RepID=A0A8X8X3H3_SALSN|nr:hypothetical protein SASPL_132582 [Salvia splendens]
MGEHQIQHPFSLPPPPLPPLPPPASPRDDSAPPEPSSLDDPSPPSAPPFDPSRSYLEFGYRNTLNRALAMFLCMLNLFCFFEVIGIIKRKAMIKELAAAYHAECLTHCQELLELQKKNEEANGYLWGMSIYPSADKTISSAINLKVRKTSRRRDHFNTIVKACCENLDLEEPKRHIVWGIVISCKKPCLVLQEVVC